MTIQVNHEYRKALAESMVAQITEWLGPDCIVMQNRTDTGKPEPWIHVSMARLGYAMADASIKTLVIE